MTVLAPLVAYVIGSLPTAGLLGKLWGVDLRVEGSGNPGANNALRTSGPMLAASVLMVHVGKGLLTVKLGDWLASDPGAVTAGLGVVAGNVYSFWYRFGGGKGLGTTLGVLLGAWPAVVLPVLGLISIAVIISRSTGLAALAAMAGLVMMSVVWTAREWPTGGVEPNQQLMVLAVGLAVILFYKHWRDSPFNEQWRHQPRGSVSPGRR